MIDTRVTDKMDKYGWWGVKYSQTPDIAASWQLYHSNTFLRPNGYNGSYKSVTSERSGRFVPGTFRANPCILREVSASGTQGSAYSNKWFIGWHFHLTGHFWYQACQLDPRFEMSELDAYNTNEAQLALVKTQAKLSEAEWNAFVALGEIGETIDLLRNPLKSFLKSFKDFLSGKNKSKRFRKTQLLGDLLSSHWLMYRYAIIPLISDIMAAIALFKKKLDQLEGMQRISSGQEIAYPVKGSVTESNSGFRWTMQYERQMYRKTIHHVYFEQALVSTNELLAKWMGFSPSQILNNAWELTRLSFVLDWVLAVGDWLSAITPDPSLKYLGNCTSQKITKRITCDVTSITHEVGLRYDRPVILPRYTWDSSTLHRQVGTTTGVLPPFNPDFLKLKRILDSISLLWQPATAAARRLR